MNTEFLIITLAGLAIGFFMSVAAIALWSRTRDSAWLLTALGAVFLFGDFILGLFEGLGIPVYRLMMMGNVSVIRIISAISPLIFLSAGFIIFLIRRHRY